MKYPEVKHLYKYYAYNENSLSVLINKKIWVAKPESFNDPFDCNYNFSLKLDEEILKQGDSNIKDIQINAAATNKVLKERFSNTGIFSMSKRNNSILMWSHYANQHKGFCIEFERKPESILGNDDVTKRVDYEDDYSDIEMFDQSGKVAKRQVVVFRRRYGFSSPSFSLLSFASGVSVFNLVFGYL